MKTKFLGIILCMLLIIPFVPATCGTEGEKTFSVFVGGRPLTSIDQSSSIPYFHFGHVSLFRADPAGNWVNLSFTQALFDTFITVIVGKNGGGEGGILDSPIKIRLGLTAPGTFLLVWSPPRGGIGRAKIIGVCDSIRTSDIHNHYSL
jgi:hypothetical protein